MKLEMVFPTPYTEIIHKHSTLVDKDVPTGIQINDSDTVIHLYLN